MKADRDLLIGPIRFQNYRHCCTPRRGEPSPRAWDSLIFSCVSGIWKQFSRGRTCMTRLYSGADGLSHFERINVKFRPCGAEHRRAIGTIDYDQNLEWSGCARGFYCGLAHTMPMLAGTSSQSRTRRDQGRGFRRFVSQPSYWLKTQPGRGILFRVLGNTDWAAVSVNLGR